MNNIFDSFLGSYNALSAQSALWPSSDAHWPQAVVVLIQGVWVGLPILTLSKALNKLVLRSSQGM